MSREFEAKIRWQEEQEKARRQREELNKERVRNQTAEFLTKYKERLNHMESQTMIMLVITGMGTMLLLLVAMMMIFSI